MKKLHFFGQKKIRRFYTTEVLIPLSGIQGLPSFNSENIQTTGLSLDYPTTDSCIEKQVAVCTFNNLIILKNH